MKVQNESIASVHEGDSTVYEFSNFCNFHKFVRGTSNLLVSYILNGSI